MFQDTDSVNEILKNKLTGILFTNFTHNTVKDISKIFEDTASEIKPQILVLEDIENFDSAVKIQYSLQGKQFSMIVDKKV